MYRDYGGMELREPTSVDEIKSGDPWEFSEGRAIYCAPPSEKVARASCIGARVIDSDPDVEGVGLDAGFMLRPRTLRAPNVAVMPREEGTGFVVGVPPLAIEYVDQDQDEGYLQAKVREFLAAGTRFFWAVRLASPPCVEIYEPNKSMKRGIPGMLLHAPDVLRNSVPVEALFDRQAADRVILHNLLQRHAYQALEDVVNRSMERD